MVWAKSAQGTWRTGHTFGDKLYFTQDSPNKLMAATHWTPGHLYVSLETHPLGKLRAPFFCSVCSGIMLSPQRGSNTRPIVRKCLPELRAAVERAGGKGYEPLNWHTSVPVFGFLLQEAVVYTDADDHADDARHQWRRCSAKGLIGETDQISLRYIEARTVTDYILGHGKRPKSSICYPSHEPAVLALVFCRPDAVFSTFPASDHSQGCTAARSPPQAPVYLTRPCLCCQGSEAEP